MEKKIIGILVCTLMVACVFQVTGTVNENDLEIKNNSRQEYDFGDAPEAGIAYPSSGVIGAFPTCKCCGPALWVQHTNFGAWFGQAVDFEPEGNGGLCPQCFPPYDQDETFNDGDTGLIKPQPFTINNSINIVPFPGYTGTPLGIIGQIAVWGPDIDIHVHNMMPNHEPYLPAYVNVLMDWNQNGKWGDPSEHVLVNFIVPAKYIGPLAGLTPPNFVIGPNPGYVWARFTISEKPVQKDWDGAEYFEDGETEDYLIQIIEEHVPVPAIDCKGTLTWQKPYNTQRLDTKTGTFEVGNAGEAGSLLDWEVTSWPDWGTWSFSPSSGTNIAKDSWVTVTATCIAPDQPNQHFTGTIEVCNSDDLTDCCTISVDLSTPRVRTQDMFFIKFLQKYPNLLIILQKLQNSLGQ